MQRRYRVLFAALGLAMIATTFPVSEPPRASREVSLPDIPASFEAAPNEPVAVFRR
jgi:hypothetical protein